MARMAGLYAAYLAAKLGVAAAIFNDAGIGRDRAGIAGLDYLAELGIPAAAVGNMTARIGDGADMMARGIVTHANLLAAAAWLPAQAPRAATPLTLWRKQQRASWRRRPCARSGILC